MPKRPSPLESQEQIAFVNWVKTQGYRIVASANGGKRHVLEAVKFKAMGVSPGFPDLFIPLPMNKYHGLFIEMKRVRGGKITDEQLDWLHYLREKGYYADVARGFDEAVEIFSYYISLRCFN